MTTRVQSVRFGRFVRTFCGVTALALGLTGSTTVAAPAGTSGAPTGSVAARQQEASAVQKLIVQLKAPKLDASQRKAIVEQLMELGDEGPRRLAQHAASERASAESAYLSKFEKAAAGVVAARVKAAGGGAKVEAEVAALRKKSLDVSHAPGLTKEQIHDVCDPAVARLTELMSVTPADVVAAAPDLPAARALWVEWTDVYRAAYEKTPEAKRERRAVPPPDAKTAEHTMAAREALLATLAMPMTKPDRSVLVGNVALAAKLDPAEADAIAALNRLRVMLGIGAQAIDPKLCDAARGHSKDMIEKGFFAHESPVHGKETPWKRAELAGTTASAENIYQGSTKGEDAIKGWWYSPGHHANMMGGGKRTGVGRTDGHFTQMFGG